MILLPQRRPKRVLARTPTPLMFSMPANSGYKIGGLICFFLALRWNCIYFLSKSTEQI